MAGRLKGLKAALFIHEMSEVWEHLIRNFITPMNKMKWGGYFLLMWILIR